jgi:hypothetical protein
MSTASVLAAIGLLSAASLGAWWTAQAVADGSRTGVIVRFTLSVAGAFYYLIMYRVATGRSLAIR